MRTNFGELNIVVKAGKAAVAKDVTLNAKTVIIDSGAYRSKLEADYAAHLTALQHVKVVTRWWYEPVRFRLAAKTSYRPDFLAQMGSALVFYEVKGWHKNRRDSLTHLKVAASMFLCFKFVLVTKEKGRWVERAVTA